VKPFRTTVAILCLFLLCHAAIAQMHVIDSLRSVINAAIPAAQKLQAYVLLTGRLGTVSFNETINVGERGLQIASEQKDSVAIAQLTHFIGSAYYFKGDYEKAATHYYSSLGMFERFNQPKEQATVLNDIAKIYRKTRDLERASATYDQALLVFTAIKDSSGIQMIYNESGVVYEYKGNYEEALKRYNTSLKIARLLKDEVGISWCYNFIAGVYLLQNKYELAEEYNLRALAIRQQQKDTFALSLSYSDLGNLYSSWGKYDRSEYYFDLSNSIADKMGYKELVSNNFQSMSQLANTMGKYKEALDYYTWHTQLKDSIFNAQKTRQIEEISTIYETTKKEKQIQEQQQTIRKRNLLLLGTIGLLLLLALLSYLIYNRYKLKQQAKLQTEILKQQELAAKSIIDAEEKERSRIAKDLHDGVGQMMSAARMNLSSFSNELQLQNKEQQHSLSNIINLVDESCKEVRAVSHSMMPQVLLKKGLPQAVEDLVSKINTDVLAINMHYEGFEERPHGNTETILFRVLQECVNNTLKHAEAKHMDISLLKEAQSISISIEDDGKGFVRHTADAEEGIGLKNIESRIRFLKGEIDFDTAPGKGTSIVIHVPLDTET
jgi:two-component system, NarL family, sensor kinase